MVNAMGYAPGEETPAIPAAAEPPPSLPAAPSPMEAAAQPSPDLAAASGAPRWLTEVALPIALGIVCAVTWAGALLLATGDVQLPFGELRVAQTALLLSVPVAIIVVGMASGGVSRVSSGSAGRSTVNGLVTLLVIALGLTLVYFASAPRFPNDNADFLLTVPFAGPGFSLGVALGYAFGARPRPTGAGVGLMGGVGFAAPMVALAVILLILASHPVGQCTGSRPGCGALVVALYTILAVILLIASVFAVALSFIGGVLGAYLRRR